MTGQRKSRRTQKRIRLLELLAAAALLIVLAVILFDWNMLRGPIERRVSAATGREFHINGNLLVDLGLKPHITLERMTLGNLPGAKDPEMASVERCEVRGQLIGGTQSSLFAASRPCCRISASWRASSMDIRMLSRSALARLKTNSPVSSLSGRSSPFSNKAHISSP